MTHLMSLTLEAIQPHIAVLTMSGEIDLACKELLDERFQSLDTDDLEYLIVDASGLTFIDSTGLQSLARGKALVGEETVMIIVPSRPLERILDLCFPGDFFSPRSDTLEQALELAASGQHSNMRQAAYG